MPKAATLNKIGSQVRVNLDLVRDRIPGKLSETLANNPRGKIVGYKMTDGIGGIGFVLELSDGTTNWFFSDEISSR